MRPLGKEEKKVFKANRVFRNRQQQVHHRPAGGVHMTTEEDK